MNLQSGSRLGPYEIVAPIGAGGMGEVYRARDTRLDRTVAVKILAHVSPTMRERFDREARTISSLSHPHICALFDVGHQDGTDYLVMEFLEGEPLASRLARGPLPAEQTIRYGIEIAAALDAAHKRGIIHRDLKPGNVIITKTGAKLVDFGLAKFTEPADTLHASQTARKPLTEEGALLGTFQYMAPEQLEGREADARTDIFALGATLYEMATGRRAFEAKSRASLIASILDAEPTPISQLQPLTPPALERAVRLCMAKEPDDRWQSAHDVAAELRWIAEGSSSASGIRPPTAIPRRILWGLAGLIAGLGIGAAGIWMSVRDRAPSAPVARFTLALPPAAPFEFGDGVALAVSPDGTRFAYVAQRGNSSILYVRALGQKTALPVAGTEGALRVVFSPDGRSIAFGTATRVKKISLDGGLPVDVADTSVPTLGLDWFGQTIYYVPQFKLGVWAVPDSGGTPRQVIKPSPNEQAVLWPQVLPDGKTIVVTAWYGGDWDAAKIVAYPIAGGQPKVIVDGGRCAQYISSGHLLYGRGGLLYAVPFQPETLQISGPAKPVLNDVLTGALNGEVQYAISKNGTLLYATGGVIGNDAALLWVDRQGREQPVVPTKRPYGTLAISPDGKTIAVTLETATFDVWQLDLDRDTVTRVSHGGDDMSPLWTPDGTRMYWSSSKTTGHYNIFSAPADNSSEARQITNSTKDLFGSCITPDGRWLAVTEQNGQSYDVRLLDLTSDHKMQPFLTTQFNEGDLMVSPDGKWIAYVSDESGRNEVYVRPFAAGGGKWQVSIDGATSCRWARNGREIFYVKGTKVYVVPIVTQPQVRIGKPQFLFEKPMVEGPNSSLWDISADSQRILMAKPESPRTANELQIVLNWRPAAR